MEEDGRSAPIAYYTSCSRLLTYVFREAARRGEWPPEPDSENDVIPKGIVNLRGPG